MKTKNITVPFLILFYYYCYMPKKLTTKQDNPDKTIAKIWCPDGEKFQYIKVCDSHCKKKDKCLAFRDYLEPKLF